MKPSERLGSARARERFGMKMECTACRRSSVAGGVPWMTIFKMLVVRNPKVWTHRLMTSVPLSARVALLLSSQQAVACYWDAGVIECQTIRSFW